MPKRTIMLQVKLEKPTAKNSRELLLTNGMVVIVDYPVPDNLLLYVWRAVCWNFRWYAYSTRRIDGTRCRIAMHRLIAETPPGEVCHHYNKNSLDNRRGNLLNQTPLHHRQLHRIRIWRHRGLQKMSGKRQ